MLLDVRNLKVSYYSGRGEVNAVKGISFSMDEGEVVGLVGESGSGKSATSLTLMGLLPGNASFSGEVIYKGTDLTKLSFDELRKIKGKEISMVFQEPMTSLNPLIRVGKQVEEMFRLHEPKISKTERRERVYELFELVELENPKVTFKKYPHELSGGMQQRVMIAMALACSPSLLIADEPTTALDAAVSDQIIDLLKEINKKKGTGIIFVSHDLNIIRKLCRRVLVMYNGEIVESGTTEQIFANPKDDYTKKLIASISEEEKKSDYKLKDPVLEVKNLSVFYTIKTEKLGAKPIKKMVCNDMTFEVGKGEILGLVGPSGIGKSSVSRAILGLHKEYTGEIIHHTKMPQMIFQDSAGALNPSKKIGWILEEPLKMQKEPGQCGFGLNSKERKLKVKEMLAKVELPEEFLKRYPRQLSGGQRQRVNIALALMSGSEFIIADEPVSALDVTIQSQILELLLTLQKELNLSMLFISHDANVIKRICDRVIEMK